jgi:hypothetical protein
MPAQKIPQPQHAFVDATNKITPPWYLFLSRLAESLSPGGSAAPSADEYIVAVADPVNLPNARVPTDSATIDFDFGTPGQLLAHVIGPMGPGCSPLTDGDLTQPELIFALGDAIMVCV